MDILSCQNYDPLGWEASWTSFTSRGTTFWVGVGKQSWTFFTSKGYDNLGWGEPSWTSFTGPRRSCSFCWISMQNSALDYQGHLVSQFPWPRKTHWKSELGTEQGAYLQKDLAAWSPLFCYVFVAGRGTYHWIYHCGLEGLRGKDFLRDWDGIALMRLRLAEEGYDRVSWPCRMSKNKSAVQIAISIWDRTFGLEQFQRARPTAGTPQSVFELLTQRGMSFTPPASSQ